MGACVCVRAGVYTHSVQVSARRREIPVRRDILGQDAEVRQPVPAPLAASEHRDHGRLVRRHVGLGVVDRVEGAPACDFVVSLRVKGKYSGKVKKGYGETQRSGRYCGARCVQCDKS